MHQKIEKFLSEHDHSNFVTGALIRQVEVSRGLNYIGADPSVCAMLDEGFEIVEATRVYFSGKIHGIDIAIRLEKLGSASQSFISTYDSLDNQLIAVTRTVHELSQEEGALPFVLEVESHAMSVVSTERQMSRLETRREVFTKALIAALLPVLGSVSPAAASSTSYSTNSQTCRNSSNPTQTGTSGLTTPNDQDTRPDTNTDNTQDCSTDTTPDSRDDP